MDIYFEISTSYEHRKIYVTSTFFFATKLDCFTAAAKSWRSFLFLQPKNWIVCKVWGLFWLYLPPYLRTASLPFWQLWTAANRKHCLWQNPKSGRRSKYNFLLSQISACKPAQVSGLHLKFQKESARTPRKGFHI